MTNQIAKLEARLNILASSPNPPIKERVDTLNELAWTLRYSDLNRCLALSTEAYQFVKPLEFTADAYIDSHLTCLRNISYFEGLKGNFDYAFSYATEALSILDNIKQVSTQQKTLKADIFCNMGMVSAFMGYYPEAVEYLFQAKTLAIETNNAWAQFQALSHLGFIQMQSSKYEQGIESINNAVKIIEASGDKGGEALGLNNLAWSYSLGGDYDLGLTYALQSKALISTMDAPYLQGVLFDTIGELYLKKGDMAQAQAFLEKAVLEIHEVDYKYNETVALINLGVVYSRQQNEAALATFQKALTVGEEIGAKHEMSQCHFHISKYYEQQEEFDKALHHYQKYHQLQQELFNSEADKKVKYLEVFHATQTAKKEVEIYQLKNVELEHEISERTRVEKELNDYKNHLEEVVQRRTHELTIANQQLQQEINNKIKVEAALRASEERHRLISELISDFAYVYEVDEEENFALEWVTHGSYLRLTGYAWSELNTLYDLYHPNDRERLHNDINRTLQGETTIGEYRVHTKQGKMRWVQIRRQPVWDESLNRTTKINCAVQDITERKLAETQLVENAAILKRRNQELQNFTHISSHDLQEPLRKIQIFSERLQAKYQESLDERGQHYLARIHDAAARSRLLIQDLLAYSQLAYDEIDVEMVNLTNTVTQVVDDLTVRIEETAASVHFHNLPIIEANPNMMYQLFLNLIINALKFHSEDRAPVLEISTQPLGDEQVEILVKDNGIGFDEKYAERIFSIFQRLHDPNEFTGTGIGLTICRRIVEQHHGQITAKSEIEKGTEFRLILPLKQP